MCDSEFRHFHVFLKYALSRHVTMHLTDDFDSAFINANRQILTGLNVLDHSFFGLAFAEPIDKRQQ